MHEVKKGKNHEQAYPAQHEACLYPLASTGELARESEVINPMIGSNAATCGHMSIILVTQDGPMLNLSGDVARVQDEMSRVWLPGLPAQRNQKNLVL